MPPRVRTPKAEVLEGEVLSAVDTVDEADLVTVGSLKIQMRKATEDQFAILAKVARAAEKDPEGASLRAVEVFFRVVENLIVNKDDVERLEDALADRLVTVQQIAKGIKVEVVDDGGQKVPTRTRRGR